MEERIRVGTNKSERTIRDGTSMRERTIREEVRRGLGIRSV